MLKKKIEDAFNKHLNAELYSSYLYLSMAAYFESLNLSGMAAWMEQQAEEEHQHAMKFFGYLNERGARVALTAIDAPPGEWASPLAVFEQTYEHECSVSELLNNLADLAMAEKDHASGAFLQWFVTEQVEEEATVAAIVGKLKLVNDHSAALLMLDGELGRRQEVAAPVA